MKKIVTLVLAVGLTTQANAQKSALDKKKYLSLSTVSIQEIPSQAPLADHTRVFKLDALRDNSIKLNHAAVDGDPVVPSVLTGTPNDLLPQFDPVGGVTPLDEINAQLDVIINMGQKIWDIAKKGQPVANLESTSASALPAGAKSWKQLGGWRVPKTSTYRVQYKNGYNMVVVDFMYQLTFLYGGNVKGKGLYITGAAISPFVHVAWGWRIDAKVSVPAIVNMGTPENPVAGIQMNLDWKVGTVLWMESDHREYFIMGNGESKSLR